MKRRTLTTCGAFAVLGAQAAFQEFLSGLPEQWLTDDKIVPVDFSTPWCTTCFTQGRVMARPHTDDPAHDTDHRLHSHGLGRMSDRM